MHGESFDDEDEKLLEKPFSRGGCQIRATIECGGSCGSPILCGFLDYACQAWVFGFLIVHFCRSWVVIIEEEGVCLLNNRLGESQTLDPTCRGGQLYLG